MDQKNRLAIFIGVVLGLVAAGAIYGPGHLEPRPLWTAQDCNPFARLARQMEPRAAAPGGLKPIRLAFPMWRGPQANAVQLQPMEGGSRSLCAAEFELALERSPKEQERREP